MAKARATKPAAKTTAAKTATKGAPIPVITPTVSFGTLVVKMTGGALHFVAGNDGQLRVSLSMSSVSAAKGGASAALMPATEIPRLIAGLRALVENLEKIGGRTDG